MQIRLYCTTHQNVLVNCGNGRFLEPTDGDPEHDAEGWVDLDFSEYYCPECKDDQGEWELQTKENGE